MYGFNWKEAAVEQAQAKSKYKVGQRVRVVKEGNEIGGSMHCADIGDIDTIVREDNGYWLGDSGWFYKEHEIEPAFLHGDKVRVTRCNGYFVTGDTGTVERQGKYAVFVKHGPYQRAGLPIEPEKLELVEAADEKTKPKFKAGDLVTTIGAGGAPGVGEVLEYDGNEHVKVKFNNGYGVCHEPESWLTLVKSAPDCPQDNKAQGISGTVFAGKITAGDYEWDLTSNTFTVSDNRPHIVALVKNGQPRPADRPYVHANLASATTEAERLARNNPGQEFAVYQRVAGRVAEVSYEMKEVA